VVIECDSAESRGAHVGFIDLAKHNMLFACFNRQGKHERDALGFCRDDGVIFEMDSFFARALAQASTSSVSPRMFNTAMRSPGLLRTRKLTV